MLDLCRRKDTDKQTDRQQIVKRKEKEKNKSFSWIQHGDVWSVEIGIRIRKKYKILGKSKKAKKVCRLSFGFFFFFPSGIKYTGTREEIDSCLSCHRIKLFALISKEKKIENIILKKKCVCCCCFPAK